MTAVILSMAFCGSPLFAQTKTTLVDESTRKPTPNNLDSNQSYQILIYSDPLRSSDLYLETEKRTFQCPIPLTTALAAEIFFCFPIPLSITSMVDEFNMITATFGTRSVPSLLLPQAQSRRNRTQKTIHLSHGASQASFWYTIYALVGRHLPSIVGTGRPHDHTYVACCRDKICELRNHLHLRLPGKIHDFL